MGCLLWCLGSSNTTVARHTVFDWEWESHNCDEIPEKNLPHFSLKAQETSGEVPVLRSVMILIERKVPMGTHGSGGSIAGVLIRGGKKGGT